MTTTFKKPIPNPFRTYRMYWYFDQAVTAYNTKHRDLFLPSGERRRMGNFGSNFAACFWRGYDGNSITRWTQRDKETLSYAVFRAGQAVRKAEGE